MGRSNHDIEVVRTLSVMDLKLKYQNSKLGFIWSFLKPLLQFTTYYIIFGLVLHYSDSADYPLRMFMGVLLWSFFTEATSMGLGSYLGKKSIITKVHTKKELLPISAFFTAAISYLLNMCIFLIAYHLATPDFVKIYSLHNLLVFILSLVSLSAFIISMNIVLANVNALFRDIQSIWEIILTYGCFLTPIMYTLPIPDRFLPLYYFVNPIAFPLECIRTVFFSTDMFLWKYPRYLLSYCGAIVFWICIAAIVNNRIKNKVADYL